MSKFPIGNIVRSVTTATLVALFVTACTSSARHDPRDPLEGWNRGVQSFNDGLDDYVMKPVSRGYQWVTPSFVDKGVTNFFNNIDDISVVANDLLQAKFLQSGKDTGRFLINSTAGLGGLFDVASKVDLTKNNEDLDQTLGFWGLPTGPYLVLPLLGPSTPRGVVGLGGNTVSNPINWITPWYIPFSVGILNTLDTRADLLSATKIADEASVDRYEFIRNAYFQQREYLVYDGSPPLDEDLEKQIDLELEGLDEQLNREANQPDSEKPDPKQ
jgi:phospholipid-binding lipoprotein MlaA